MTSLAYLAILELSVLSGGASGYSEARQSHLDTGRPMVLLVGAEWCPACVRMKNQVLPNVARRGTLEKVAFAHVNTDRESRVAKSVMQGNSIPQVIMYRKTFTGWRRHQLVGAQSSEAIEAFIERGLELDKADALQAKASARGNKVSYQPRDDGRAIE